ncbi:pendolino [Carabus blaptoides fortunei]
MLQASVRSSVSSSKGESSEGNFTRQGSLRKVLPADPNKHPKLGYHNEEAQKIYKIFHQEYIILAEYKMLQSENIRGIYVIPSRESSLLWFGVIFVRSGFYNEAVFRFNISLPDTFPDCDHPKVTFTSDIFHPVIDGSSGELNLKAGFPEWKKGEHHIWQILKYINWIFDNLSGSIEHAVNEEASYMYKNDVNSFKSRVQSCVKLSIERAYDPPPTEDKHYLTFEVYQPSVHDTVRQSMLTYKPQEKSTAVGHSWVAPGTFKPLSRLPNPEAES